MIFNSYVFILFFLPVTIVGYYLINRTGNYRAGLLFLVGMSLWFYGYFNVSYIAVIAFSVLANYFCYRLMRYIKKRKRTVLIFGICINILMLMYFKYMDFFISNINGILKTNYALLKITLPLGISFFTFQQLGFLVDAYREEVPSYDFLEYVCFVSFFPQLVAGPIVAHNDIIPQFLDPSKKKVNWNNLSRGFYIFTWGLTKKVLVADTFGNAVNWGYSHIEVLDSTNALVVMLAYTFQIYFDFSGYCDMAVGLGKMLNIDLPINFNSPYKATTISEFWERWHITLTSFFTKYLYILLGGNRKGKLRTCINTLIVFLVSGFWHGAGWNFILWGGMHGIAIVFDKCFGQTIVRVPKLIRRCVTFLFVNVTWILFRAPSIEEAGAFFQSMCSMKFGSVLEEISECFSVRGLSTLLRSCFPMGNASTLCLGLCFLLCLVVVMAMPNTVERMKKMRFSLLEAAMCAMLLVWNVISFSGVSTFLYFNF